MKEEVLTPKELENLERRIEASKEIYPILLKLFDSEEILDVLTRVISKVLRHAPNESERKEFFKRLEKGALKRAKERNLNESISLQEEGSNVKETVTYEDFEFIFEKIRAERSEL